MFHSGKADVRVTFESIIHTVNAAGGIEDTSGNDYHCWARITPESSAESNGQAATSYIIDVRACAESKLIQPRDRMRIDATDEIYMVESVVPYPTARAAIVRIKAKLRQDTEVSEQPVEWP